MMQLSLEIETEEQPNIKEYDRYLVAFSGGKDSIASLLALLDTGVERSKIELHHHIGGNSGKLGTRRKFPAMVADLRTRWCSSYGKIDVFAGLIRAQPRFQHSRTLVITGERAQESASRAKYQVFEPHRTDSRGRLGRQIDHWRPVHRWSEKQVWGKLQEAKINPHPAYKLGFGRLSCARCIFSSPNQWATNMEIAPKPTGRMVEYEQEFGHTIDGKQSIREKTGKGEVYRAIAQYPKLVEIAIGREYSEPIFVEKWEMPSGAFGEGNGSI